MGRIERLRELAAQAKTNAKMAAHLIRLCRKHGVSGGMSAYAVYLEEYTYAMKCKILHDFGHTSDDYRTDELCRWRDNEP